jgi:Cof subfamily protein (haloacid dehalogenase superfamily)
MSAVRLLLADVDGTLLTSKKVLTERARQAVLRLREARISFAITSGRPPRGMSMLTGPLAIATPIGAFNGGALLKPDLSLLEEKCIPPAVVQPILAEITSRGLDAWVYRGAEWLARDPHAPHVDREERTVEFPPTIVPDFSEVWSGVIKIVGVSDDLHLVERCEAQVRERFADHVSAARSQAYYLDVTHPEANKGAVVRRLSALLDVPREEIATIGDMPNDVLMFAGSGLSIAMGNASRDVQRCARAVTTSNDDEGFANAVEHYILAPQVQPGRGRGNREEARPRG